MDFVYNKIISMWDKLKEIQMDYIYLIFPIL